MRASQAVFLTALALTAPAAVQTQVSPGALIIIDGDTVALGKERLRLKGPDTPESFRPRCEAELVIALKAKERLRQLIDSGPVTITRHSRDRYARTLATLRVNGTDVGETLVAEGLAIPWRPGRAAWLQRARHWCPDFTQE